MNRSSETIVNIQLNPYNLKWNKSLFEGIAFMQRKITKKISIALLVAMLGLSLTACEMDPAMLEMFVSVLAGFCGVSGGPFAQMAGGQGAQGMQMGNMLRGIFESSSNTGDGMSSVMQGNQMTMQGMAGFMDLYSSNRERPTENVDLLNNTPSSPTGSSDKK